MIFVANFKMMLTTPMIIKLVRENLSGYKELCATNSIILCPPATAIRELFSLLSNSCIKIGAQTCSSTTTGAFTGEISPADLAACGAVYCLIGHSERRNLFYETSETAALKASLAANNNLIPIVCIGEKKEDHDRENTLEILDQQLNPVFQRFNELERECELYIAYEPVWAIGTGLTPRKEPLGNIFTHIRGLVAKKHKNLRYKLLYGGSVSSKTISIFKEIDGLDGFLIGNASLDFQEFKKIVDSF